MFNGLVTLFKKSFNILMNEALQLAYLILYYEYHMVTVHK